MDNDYVETGTLIDWNGRLGLGSIRANFGKLRLLASVDALQTGDPRPGAEVAFIAHAGMGHAMHWWVRKAASMHAA